MFHCTKKLVFRYLVLGLLFFEQVILDSTFTKAVRNKKLQHRDRVVLKEPTIVRCLASCEYVNGCKSVNYHYGDKICEVMRHTAQNEGDNTLEEAHGWYYYEKNEKMFDMSKMFLKTNDSRFVTMDTQLANTPSTFPEDWFITFNVKIDMSTGDGQILRMTKNNDVILDVKKMSSILKITHERNGEKFELMTNSLDVSQEIHQVMIGFQTANTLDKQLFVVTVNGYVSYQGRHRNETVAVRRVAMDISNPRIFFAEKIISNIEFNTDAHRLVKSKLWDLVPDWPKEFFLDITYLMIEPYTGHYCNLFHITTGRNHEVFGSRIAVVFLRGSNSYTVEMEKGTEKATRWKSGYQSTQTWGRIMRMRVEQVLENGEYILRFRLNGNENVLQASNGMDATNHTNVRVYASDGWHTQVSATTVLLKLDYTKKSP
ncbi:uncharacterized protein [Clytia hemisphaerica]|uniref:Apple domain-containing protein n=1 Tax=Clytia hemisphaerica TaxID=252671 RepID=A0A7M5VDH1_9CNID|eukprot:TCONS_00009400-protein